ncbi:MAG: MotA/TolQ/ExbB proton channel family protein [Chlamydiota bacterium]|nr:MotA/TolQ/ExbB proton channel family protein [Chlamydiota bacterium]
MIEILHRGGPMMIPIILGSIIAIAIVIERLIHLHREHIDTEKFMAGIKNIIKKGNIVEVVAICESTPGPVAKILKEGMLYHDLTKEEMREAMDEVAMYEVPLLEKNLTILATIAYIEPLLGLLGTVTGMINSFMKIEQFQGFVNTGDLAAGIWEALITTAAGLTIAIPAYVAYNYLVSRIEGFVREIDKCTSQLIGYMYRGEDDTNR